MKGKHKMLKKLSIIMIVAILLLAIPIMSSKQNEKSIVSAATFDSINSLSKNDNVGTQSASESILKNTYDLSAERPIKSRYYYMETKIVNLGADGTRAAPVTFRLLLNCVPAGLSPQDGYRYTCAKITIQRENEPEVVH